MTGLIGNEIKIIREKLAAIYGGPCRIAVAIYDARLDVVKTFAHSTEGGTPLRLYEAALSDVPSLQAVYSSGQARVLNDLPSLSVSPSEHSRKILAAGYQSSYTYPLVLGNKLLGFMFSNSKHRDFFTGNICNELKNDAKILAALLAVEISSLQTLSAALHTAVEFSRFRDEETANHLKRMSNYSRIIAKTVAPTFGLEDEQVEYIAMFAELHDLGKIGTPDKILLKPGKLSPQEFEKMKDHTVIGKRLAEMMIMEFGLDELRNTELLINIIYAHHERVDGKGYPRGLAGEAIPKEARIVTVADVFDALTSKRPYKEAWSFDQAYDFLKQGAGTQFDAKCVEAAINNRQQFLEISRRFAD